MNKGCFKCHMKPVLHLSRGTASSHSLVRKLRLQWSTFLRRLLVFNLMTSRHCNHHFLWYFVQALGHVHC